MINNYFFSSPAPYRRGPPPPSYRSSREDRGGSFRGPPLVFFDFLCIFLDTNFSCNYRRSDYPPPPRHGSRDSRERGHRDPGRGDRGFGRPRDDRYREYVYN